MAGNSMRQAPPRNGTRVVFDSVSSITWLSLAQKFLLHRHSGLRPKELPAS